MHIGNSYVFLLCLCSYVVNFSINGYYAIVNSVQRLNIMRCIILFFLGLVSLRSSCQPTKGFDTCQLKPSAFNVAYFNGLKGWDTILVENLIKSGKLISGRNDFKISSFVFIIDGPDYDIVERKVYSDSFSEEDIKIIKNIRIPASISIECIIGKNKKNEFIRYKPIFFYIN